MRTNPGRRAALRILCSVVCCYAAQRSLSIWKVFLLMRVTVVTVPSRSITNFSPMGAWCESLDDRKEDEATLLNKDFNRKLKKLLDEISEF